MNPWEQSQVKSNLRHLTKYYIRGACGANGRWQVSPGDGRGRHGTRTWGRNRYNRGAMSTPGSGARPRTAAELGPARWRAYADAARERIRRAAARPAGRPARGGDLARPAARLVREKHGASRVVVFAPPQPFDGRGRPRLACLVRSRAGRRRPGRVLGRSRPQLTLEVPRLRPAVILDTAADLLDEYRVTNC